MSESEEILNHYETVLNELHRLWNNYREAVQRAISTWIMERPKVISKISELQGLLEHYEEELRELTIKHELGLLDEDKLEESARPIREEVERLSAQLQRLLERLRRIEKGYVMHAFQARLPFTGASIREIREKLSKLEEMYQAGRIREVVYRKLRRELEEQLRILEASVAELEGRVEERGAVVPSEGPEVAEAKRAEAEEAAAEEAEEAYTERTSGGAVETGSYTETGERRLSEETEETWSVSETEERGEVSEGETRA